MIAKFNLKKNIYFAVFSFAINIGLVFVSYKFVIHYSGLEALGLWSLLMAWASFVKLGDVGMGNATLHFVSKIDIDKDWLKIQKFIDTGFLMNMIAFLILTLIGYIIISANIDFIIKNDSFIEETKEILPYMLSVIFFTSMSSVVFGNLQGLHFGYISSVLTVLGNILQIILVILLVPKHGILGLVWAQLIQYVLLFIIGLIIIKVKSNNRNILPTNFSLETLKEMLGYSLKAQFANILNGLFEPLTKVIFGQYGDLKSQGIYEIAYKTVSLSRNLVVSGITATLPSMTNILSNDNEKAVNFYKTSNKKVSKIIIVMMLLVSLTSPIISYIWIGHFQIDYTIYVSIIALGFLINTFGATAYNIGLALGKMKNNIISTIIVLITFIITGIILGNIFYALGIVIATMLSLSIGGLLIKYKNEKLLFERV